MSLKPASGQHRRAQIFFIEFFLAVSIFTLAIILFYRYDVLDSGEDTRDFRLLVQDAQSLSDTLIGAGLPAWWNASTVTRVGLTNDDQRIDLEKLEAFHNLSYADQRFYVGTEHDFSFRFLRSNLSVITFWTNTTEFGVKGIDAAPLSKIPDLERLITIERAVIVDDAPGLLQLYVWKD